MLDKPALRKALLAVRQNFAPDLRLLADQEIIQSLFSLAEWQNARVVGCYLSLPHEVPTQSIIQAGLKTGKLLGAPVITNKSEPMHFYQLALSQTWQAGPLGILQPPRDRLLPPEKIDLLIVPGLGFDLRGYRLGYGGGFYDRYLAHFHGKTVALAYALQVQEELPVTPRDQPVQMLVTETRVINFRRPDAES